MVDTLVEKGVRKLISFGTYSTGAGGAGGSSIVCSLLTAQPDFNGATVVIASGAFYGQSRTIIATTTGGVITPDRNFDGVIPINTAFLIVVNNQPGVPAKNSTNNVFPFDVIGSKEDDPVVVVSDTASIPAYLKGILNTVISIAGGTYWLPFGPTNIQVGNAATHGVTLFDPGGGIIPLADITPGTYTIDRIRGAVLANIVAATPSTPTDGAVYENYAWPGADWSDGDLCIITFTGISITIGTVTTDLPPIQIWGRVVTEPDILIAVQGKPNVNTIRIYPVAVAASVVDSVLDDDGLSPLYVPVPADSTASNDPLAPGVAWVQSLHFEQEGTVYVIDWSAHLEWQTQFTVGGGGGTNSLSKVQMSIDGGVSWLDMTDLFTNPNAVMTPRTREGQRLFASGIAVGATQLQFRLIHYTDDVGGVSTSEAQIRENSYIELTYRKA